MERLFSRQFLNIGTVVIVISLLVVFGGVGETYSWLCPSPVSSDPLIPRLEHREQGKIKSDELTFSGEDFTHGQSAGLRVYDGKLLLSGTTEGVFTSPVIEAPIPFAAIGPHWVADASTDGNIGVQVRTSLDGADWSPWHTVGLETPYGSTPNSEYYGQLVFASDNGELSRYVQYKLVITADARMPKKTPTISRFSLTFIDPSEGPTTTEALSAQGLASADGISAQGAVGKPPVISRTAWGCPDGQSSPGWGFEYRPVTHLVVHHTTSSNSTSDWKTHVCQVIWYYHAITLGWGDIGYNYLVDPNGNIYEGRAGGDNVIAGHVYGFNAGTMGVGCLGSYGSVSPSGSLRSALESLLAWKCSQRGLSPTGGSLITGTNWGTGQVVTVYQPTITSHRDFPGHSGDECPGQQLWNILPTIRSNVSNKLTPGDTTPPTATMGVLPRYTRSTSFGVSWSGSDASGIKSYDVQYKVGASGSWTTWLSGTDSTSATFSGQNGSTYYFRCRATDNYNNTGNWSNESVIAIDTGAPSCGVADPNPQPTRTWFMVKCWSWDQTSGVKSFDIDYRDNGSAWQPWLRNADSGQSQGTTGTTYTEFLFEGKPGHTYTFRCRVYDYVGNASNGGGWSTDEATYIAGSDSSGLFRTRLPLIMKNAS